ELPEKLDLISYVAHSYSHPEHTKRATLLVAPGRAAGVRRWAESVTPADAVASGSPASDRATASGSPGGSSPDAASRRGDVVVIGYSDPCGFASWIVGYGADVE